MMVPTPATNGLEAPSPHVGAQPVTPMASFRPLPAPNQNHAAAGGASSNNNNENGDATQGIGAASVATHVTSGSNAFEGALDGLDFGMDLFGMDSTMGYTGGYGMSPGYGRMEM